MASKRHQRRSACGTKRAYPDQTAAVRANATYSARVRATTCPATAVHIAGPGTWGTGALWVLDADTEGYLAWLSLILSGGF